MNIEVPGRYLQLTDAEKLRYAEQARDFWAREAERLRAQGAGNGGEEIRLG